VTDGDLEATAEVQTRDEIGFLASTLNSMTTALRGLVTGLETRVAERTADLEAARQHSEKRARELQAIAEMSSLITSEPNVESLLPLTTRLVSDRFGYYHAGIFLIDASGRYASLKAANSPGGQRMLARGHRLEVGVTGIVGQVAQSGKPRIALDVGDDPVFFDNPDLPETRSEMGLPLNSRGRTIGVLDVQSQKPGAFTEEDASNLSILADQVAAAIENATLHGQTQEALAEAKVLYSQYLQQSWSQLSDTEAGPGYVHELMGGRRLEAVVDNPDINAALEHGRVTVVQRKARTARCCCPIAGAGHRHRQRAETGRPRLVR
jgi:putative methionine-R-sulfoxide reductase with GAF domain